MKEIPMLFSTAMVQALVAGRKTKTRRSISNKYIINDEPGRYKFLCINENWEACFKDLKPEITPWMTPIPCPYGQPGDLIWVRETWMRNLNYHHLPGVNKYIYKENASKQFLREWAGHWRPSIHMPKEAARIWLRVKSIAVERLAEITPRDIYEEGFGKFTSGGKSMTSVGIDMKHYEDKAIRWFTDLWNSINGTESWDANPYVWVVEFEVVSTTGKPSPETLNPQP